MSREELLNWFTSALIARGVVVRRYAVEPNGLEDLEVQAPDGVVHRLRIVRTGQH